MTITTPMIVGTATNTRRKMVNSVFIAYAFNYWVRDRTEINACQGGDGQPPLRLLFERAAADDHCFEMSL